MAVARKIEPANRKAPRVARPRDRVDIAEMHARIAKRFPQILAELAK